MCSLSSAKDLTGWKLFDPCVELLKSRLESRELDKEVWDELTLIFEGCANMIIELRDFSIINNECSKLKKATICLMELKVDGDIM